LLPVAAQHPEHTQVLRSLSVFHSRIGEVLRGQGDLRGALEGFRQSQALGLTLAAREPLNQDWQRDVAIDHQTIANVLQEQGDRKTAEAELRAAQAIYERRAAIDPSSVEAQGDVASVANNEAKLCADSACAARAYRRASELYRALEARAPTEVSYAFLRTWTQLQLASHLHVLHDPSALAVARDGLAAASAWARTTPTDVDGPVLIGHGKLVVAQIIAGTTGNAAESRRLASEALQAFRAVSLATQRAPFFAETSHELELAESLAHGR
jgi:tetratricopeptide (TPR) repeat protein